MKFEQIVDEVDANYYGPHTPEQVIEAARTTAQAARYLHNAAGQPGTLPYPAVCAVLTELYSTADRLDQLAGQLSTAASRLADDPGLRDDRGNQSALVTADALLDELAEVGGRAKMLARPLARASRHASHLWHDTE